MIPAPRAGQRTHVVGVDQTGAAVRKGRAARPLPVVHLRWRGAWTLSAALDGAPRRAETLSVEVLGATSDTLVCVDAVLGLPVEAWPLTGETADAEGLRALFARAAAWPGGFGRRPAEAFFGGFDPGGDGLREQDRAAGAQSVFRSVPYQRQVLTGTYRVWRDLGRDPMAFSLHGFETLDSRPHLAETWPTLGWRAWLGCDRRQPERLPALLEAHGVRLGPDDADVLIRSADHADAAVAAGFGAWIQASRGLEAPSTRKGEGALLGWPEVHPG